MEISARNGLKGKVESVKLGEVVASVKIKVDEPGMITAVITRESVEELGISEGDDVKAIIKGYADKDTGTEEYNRQLSEKRANAVKDIIVGHGVDESRLSIEGLGDSAQPYSDNNNWNRVVLIEFE